VTVSRARKPPPRKSDMHAELNRLERREWWLWATALAVTFLSGVVFLLSAFPALFLPSGHFYEIRSDQATWAILSLLLLFNVWFLYREWWFRAQRKQWTSPAASTQGLAADAHTGSAVDDLTGLHTRNSAEQLLGKEVARARRNNFPLSLIALHLDDFAELSANAGNEEADRVLKDFANLLKKASRGSDFCARLASDAFLMVLPECSLSEAKIVSDRLGSVEMKCAGENVALSYSVGWIDYKPGEVPTDLLRRADDVLRLYKTATIENAHKSLVGGKPEIVAKRTAGILKY
jgi:diguanylate cyclase (GGDEF)-like protein